jgi:D-alanyl-lipoteichoic acid acyltransferase DltB (MBOAT superfamily)
MLFTDPLFLFVLLPAAAFLFYKLAPKYGPSAGLGLLFVMSLLFYLPWGCFYFALLVLSFTANFATAYFLLRIPDSSKRSRVLVLVLGQLYNFGTLFWFKYRFYVAGYLGLETVKTFSIVDLAIPIGISFYTFQQAMFLVDTYHRDPSVVAYLGGMETLKGKLRGYIHHAFFVSFFAHLVIGPIVYLKEFQPQVESKRFGRLRWVNIEVGGTLIALGLFKKFVLADNLAVIADKVFTASEAHLPLSPAVAWAGAAAYYAQLYFDFSGYSDLALGAARIFGIVFPINFFSPLKAVGIIDFYKRWHITLTRVISRFLYLPLSVMGTRIALRRSLPKRLIRVFAQWIPLLLNFEAIALWHGARDTFVVFGLIHGSWYVVESEVRSSRVWKWWRGKTSDRLRGYIGRAIFLFPMMLTFALFRSSTLSGFGHLLTQLFGDYHSVAGGPNKFLRPPDVLIMLASYSVLWLMPNTIEFLRNYHPGILTYDNRMYGWRLLRFAWRPNWFWALAVGGIFIASLYFIGRQPPFLYMGF